MESCKIYSTQVLEDAYLSSVRVFLYSAFYTANRFTMCTKFPTAYNAKQLYLGMMHTVIDSLVLHLFANFSRKSRQQCALLRMCIKQKMQNDISFNHHIQNLQIRNSRLAATSSKIHVSSNTICHQAVQYTSCSFGNIFATSRTKIMDLHNLEVSQ